MISRSRIIFFIPGRIRIHILDLLRQGKEIGEICCILEDVHGVISVHSNVYTENILVCYDPETTDENKILKRINDIGESTVTNGFRPPFSTKIPLKRHNPAIYQNERKISARWMKMVLFIGGLTFAFNFILRRLLSILIFACPVFIFAAPASAFYYTALRARNRRIFIRNKASLDLLDKIESVYLNDSIFLLDEPTHASTISPVNQEIYDFVFGIRENGVTDIALLVEKNRAIAHRAADQLGIEEIYHLNNEVNRHGFLNDHSLIVITEHDPNLTDSRKNSMVIHVFGKDYQEIPASDLTVQFRDLHRIPWLFRFGHYCREWIIRCQNMAIAIQTLGILAAAFGYIGPLGALAVYGFNTAWQPILIKSRIVSYKKEIDNGEKLSVCQ